MQTKRLALIFAATALLGASALFAASPAATQKWVQDYVAAHGGGGGGGPTNGVTMAWVINYVRTNAAPTAAIAAQDERAALRTRMQNALALAMQEASSSGLHALSFSHADALGVWRSVKMAERNGGGWTNVIYGCGVSTNADYEAVLSLNALDYHCATFSNYTGRNVFSRIDGDVTNSIYVGYSPITTNDYKTARGEN